MADGVSHPYVLVTGHPFVDVWAGIRPSVIGIDAWPDVPLGVPWKEGLCRALGTDVETFWPRLRNRVKTYADLRPEFVGAVEQLLDFVIAGLSAGLSSRDGSLYPSPHGTGRRPRAGERFGDDATQAQAVPRRPLLDRRRQEVRDGDHRA